MKRVRATFDLAGGGAVITTVTESEIRIIEDAIVNGGKIQTGDGINISGRQVAAWKFEEEDNG